MALGGHGLLAWLTGDHLTSMEVGTAPRFRLKQPHHDRSLAVPCHLKTPAFSTEGPGIDVQAVWLAQGADVEAAEEFRRW
jgi:hypothetical protein